MPFTSLTHWQCHSSLVHPLIIVATSHSSFLPVHRRHTFNFSEHCACACPNCIVWKNSGGEEAKISIEGSNK